MSVKPHPLINEYKCYECYEYNYDDNDYCCFDLSWRRVVGLLHFVISSFGSVVSKQQSVGLSANLFTTVRAGFLYVHKVKTYS